MYNDTICAISTPAGIGGIAVVRVSGPAAIEACSALFLPFKASHQLDARPSHTLTFGQLVDPRSHEVIDEVVVSLYRAPHSFTGEDVVEISCHGSVYIQQRVLEVLCAVEVAMGRSIEGSKDRLIDGSMDQSVGEAKALVRLAEPGEFTRRAFASGRFDLAQAEAVADLISAQSAASHRLAMQQMKGSVSQKLASLHDQLLQLTALLELELDFSEEDVEFADRTRLINLAHDIDDEVMRLAGTFQRGQAIKNGIPVAIIGAPNVGKSTLLNALLREDRAIVSDIQGTTRDLIEDTITLQGYLFRFIDTAGIRHTTDQIEQLGIERSHQAAQRAQIVLLITEPSIDYPEVEVRDDQQVIYILNKVDRSIDGLMDRRIDVTKNRNLEASPLPISAKTGQGLPQLEAALVACVQSDDTQSSVILTNARHHEALLSAHEALQRVLSGLSSQLSNEFVDMDLKDVIAALNQILGREITSQNTLNTIFRQFCIGK